MKFFCFVVTWGYVPVKVVYIEYILNIYVVNKSNFFEEKIIFTRGKYTNTHNIFITQCYEHWETLGSWNKGTLTSGRKQMFKKNSFCYPSDTAVIVSTFEGQTLVQIMKYFLRFASKSVGLYWLKRAEYVFPFRYLSIPEWFPCQHTCISTSEELSARLQQKIWNKASKDTLGLTAFYQDNKLKYQNKPFKDVKGFVINDYQKEIETAWISELRKKNKIKIKSSARFWPFFDFDLKG